MQNVEFKAELREPDLARAALLAKGAKRVAVLRQTDTYFRVATGRLKRREIDPLEIHAPGLTSESTGARRIEWILYERPDRADARVSDYHLFTEDQARERFGRAPLPTLVEVRKVRELLLAGPDLQIRCHLDDVDSLGRFLEFEALVTPAQDEPTAHARLERLVEAVRPALGEPISSSYSDLLLA